jgi:RHS repeat-associated protein
MIASVRSIDGIDRHTAYEYWPDGTLAEKRESNGDARTYVYGAGVEMLSETYAFGGAVETTDYVWCMGKLVGRVTARNPGTEEVATDCAYYLTDQIGSVVAALDANANVLYTDEFDAFGASSTYGAKPETARFTGKHYDADVGLYYYNARWYNHKTGRFSTEDPLRDGNNWYMYCQNNPMTWIDPTGTQMTQDSVTNDTHDGGGVVTPSEVYSAEDFKNAVQADLDKYKTAAEKKDDEIKKEIKRMEAWGVFAVWDGVVMKVGRVEDDPNNPYGNRVYIKHPDGSVTMYAHLDSIPAWVVVGAEVAEGQQIGVMGKTGTDNKHLHFSYFKPGVKGYTSGYASDGSAFIAAHSMPCNTYACNPYGSSACNPKLSKHEGIDFSGLECNLIPDWQYGLSGVFLTNALYDDRLETVKK